MCNDFILEICDFDDDGKKSSFEFAAEAFLINEIINDDDGYDDDDNDYED